MFNQENFILMIFNFQKNYNIFSKNLYLNIES